MGDSVSKYAEKFNKQITHERSLYPGDIKVTVNSYPHNEIVPKGDKYVNEVTDLFKQRSDMGIKKYGTTLEREDVDLLGWLTHLQEELMDATLYIQRLKSEVTKDS